MNKTVLSALGLLVILGCSSSESPTNGSAGNAGTAAGGTAGATGGAGGDAGSVGIAGEAGAAGAGGGAGGAAGAAGVGGGAGASGDPQTLFETGLYADAAMTQLAEGVMEFTPQFALWSDGAEKRRFILLPPDTQIDTSDMDHWAYPVGTKVWKEFTRDTKRIETRLLMKKDATDWFMGAYEWTEDLTAATLVARRGRQNALGTDHDIPSTQDCGDCHMGQPDKILGFSAIQLSHAGSAVNLQSLKAANLLSAPPVVDAFDVPGNTLERATLGMLHANCGTCHNPNGSGYDRNNMELWLTVDSLGDITQTAPYLTAIGVPLDGDLTNTLPGITHRVVPGAPDQSALYLRMNERDAERLIAMPPLGTELLDSAGLQLLSDWITALPPVADAGDAG